MVFLPHLRAMAGARHCMAEARGVGLVVSAPHGLCRRVEGGALASGARLKSGATILVPSTSKGPDLHTGLGELGRDHRPIVHDGTVETTLTGPPPAVRERGPQAGKRPPSALGPKRRQTSRRCDPTGPELSRHRGALGGRRRKTRQGCSRGTAGDYSRAALRARQRTRQAQTLRQVRRRTD